MYGKIDKDTQVFEYAPINFVAPDGTTIFNFTSNETLMKEYGFKEVINTEEPMDLGNGEVAIPHYKEEGDYITESWEVIVLQEEEG